MPSCARNRRKRGGTRWRRSFTRQNRRRIVEPGGGERGRRARPAAWGMEGAGERGNSSAACRLRAHFLRRQPRLAGPPALSPSGGQGFQGGDAFIQRVQFAPEFP